MFLTSKHLLRAFYKTLPSKNPSKNLVFLKTLQAPSKNPSEKHLLLENLLRTLLRSLLLHEPPWCAPYWCVVCLGRYQNPEVCRRVCRDRVGTRQGQKYSKKLQEGQPGRPSFSERPKWRAKKKAHKLLTGTNWVCPRAGLPLCKIKRQPGFVPGTKWVCPRDKSRFVPGTISGSSLGQPDQKVYVYLPFSCLTKDVPHTGLELSFEGVLLPNLTQRTLPYCFFVVRSLIP